MKTKKTGFRVTRSAGSVREPGMTLVCGIDEAGRGALAGPLVAAAVILPCSLAEVAARANIKVIRDGKLLRPKQRTAIYRALLAMNIPLAIHVISEKQINSLGIGWANREAMRALVKIMEAERYILDGKLNIGKIKGKTSRVQSIIDADATIAEVILAGIVAKVARDTLMRKLHRLHPEYRWWTNKGYGTRDHILALRKHGSVKHHRTLFVTTALKKLDSGSSPE